MLRKIIVSTVVILIFSIIGFILFFPFESFIKEQITKTFNSKVMIKELRINFYSVSAREVMIKADSYFFSHIREVELKLYLFPLLKKRMDIKSITLYDPNVTLVRTNKGNWVLPIFQSKSHSKRDSIELILRAFNLYNGRVFIKDEQKQFYIELFNINLTMESNEHLFKSGEGIITASARFKDSGELYLNSEGDFSKKIFKGFLILKNLNANTIKPLLSGNARIKKGIFSLNFNFILNNDYLKASSQLIVRDLELESNGLLMGVGTPLLLELLKKKGEIVVNFNVWGPVSNLQSDLEDSLKRKISEELGKTVVSPFKTLTKPFQSLFKKY